MGTGAVAKRNSVAFTNEMSLFSVSLLLPVNMPATRFTFASGVAPGINLTQAELQFSWASVGTASTNYWFQVDDMQLEPVANATDQPTDFERFKFEEQLALCMRHFETTFPYGTAPAQNGGIAGALGFTSQITTAASAFAMWNFKEPKRIAPAITTFNPSVGNANWRDATGGGDVVVTVDPNTAKSVDRVFIGSQTTALTAVHNLYIHASADAGI